MATNRDWLSHSRTGQLNMAKVWLPVMTAKKTLWSIPDLVLTEFQPLITDAETILAQLVSPDRSNITTAEANRIYGALITYMRSVKDRYFKSPPLVDEDYVALLLHIPDGARTPRGIPRAQMIAEIRRSGTDMLILVYAYGQGTEHLADPHTDISKQVRWGLLPPAGMAPQGRDLLRVPADPLELPEAFDTHRRTDIIQFPMGSSGKTAYFCIRLHNGKLGYGPWCPIFSAVVP